ncbi:molybdate ABC transporter substrate-binding protein [Denitrobaculum tricleocarpae]|uniref:Molybdate ABC transporter substrate-binding protein n=2 Tax=Denitrobaculum tricleocarpae TaxID=2591009 RepID=A0A545TL83_9PROT|nr:molybdate ABC transporter substrate-binding protein [Denitrobaculum tricleocarpae]
MFLAAVMGLAAMNPAGATELKLIAAGSLKAALGEVARAYEAESGTRVETTFGPSGLMREKIEASGGYHVFASANMKHPAKLFEAGKSGTVKLFARNKLCALAQPGLKLESDHLLDTMLSTEIKLGTSTPKADPSGDYAFELFDKAESLRPGAAEKLKAKSLQLTGGKTTARAPEGRNQYAWVMERKQADIFLTYCTNAVLAQRELERLQIVTLPGALSVGADYGLTVISGAPEGAASLADFILSAVGQKILDGYGFETVRPGSD